MWAGTDFRWFPPFFKKKKTLFITIEQQQSKTLEQNMDTQYIQAQVKIGLNIRTERSEDLMGLGFSSALCSITVQR